MKLAIVDDNKTEQEIILNTLHNYEKTQNISLEISTYFDGISFFDTYTPGDFDLIFMDIFLKEETGIEIVRKIRQTDSKVLIVFLTSSAEHIYEAAPFHFFDYILKPFEPEQVFHVLNEAFEALPKSEPELSFQYRSFDIHFPLSKIQYIYSNNHEIVIHTTNGSQSFRLPFYEISDHITDPRFLLCNRGIMLNMDYIKTMDSDYFEMTDTKCFPIKTKGRKQIREQYIKYQFQKIEKG